MTDNRRLVVLTSADSQDLTDPLHESLAAWCRAGMFGNVIWVSAHELRGHGNDALCWFSSDGEWLQTTLGQAMSSRALSEVWLAALRHPEGVRDSSTTEQVRHAEEEAHEAISSSLGSGISFMSMTVGVASVGAELGFADTSPLWDLHLIHDSKVEAHESAPKEVAAQSAPLELCAVVALCASGGWRGVSGGLELPPDRADGPMQPVRFVHCQVRILHTPSAARMSLPSSMPVSPPWPLPNAAGVVRAMPTAVPPLSVAEKLAVACQFRCNQPPYRPDPVEEFVLTRLWRGLFRPIPVPAAQSDPEVALRRLADRTGGLKDEDDHGLARLRLEGADELIGLEHHIRRSDFPLPGGSSGASRPTPSEWQTFREVMFGLADGGPLPGGVPLPRQGEGEDAVRLVWTDPAGLAPPTAPTDASDVLLGPEMPTDDLLEVREENDDAKPADTDTVPEEPNSEEPEGDGAVAVQWASRSRYASSKSDWSESDHEAIGHSDTLMARMSDAIHRALRSAHQGFTLNAVLCLVGNEYEKAVRAQKWARRCLKLLGAALVIVVVAALDDWWPFLGQIWEFATPFDARRIFGRDLWPIGWLVIGSIVLMGGVAWFSVQASRLLENLRSVQQANALRRRYGANATHYASELLRLRSVAEQFTDHRMIITEFLYRPFGNPGNSADDRFSTADLQFDNAPPPSMLVASAEAAPDRVDALQGKQQASSIRQGWLTGAYRKAASVWSERYQWRIVGDFDDPDHDDTPPGSVLHRDRHDGSDVFGARTDFLHGVVGDPSKAEGGWVVRKAADERFAGQLQDAEGGIQAFLELLGPLVPIHGSPAGIDKDALRFMTFGKRRHWFEWRDVLAPGANSPRVDQVESAGLPWLVPDAGEGRSLVLAWHMDLSGPVRPQDLAGWRMGGETRDSLEPTEQVV